MPLPFSSLLLNFRKINAFYGNINTLKYANDRNVVILFPKLLYDTLISRKRVLLIMFDVDNGNSEREFSKPA